MPWPVDPTAPDRAAGGCARVRDWIDLYLDEIEGTIDDPDAGLDPVRRRALEEHAAECPDCRGELALARRLRRSLRQGLPLLACPPEVTDAVLRVVAEERASAAPPAPADPPAAAAPTRIADRRGDRLRRWLGAGALRPALAAAALVLLALAAPLLLRTALGPGGELPGSGRAAVEPPEAPPDPGAARGGEPEYTAAEVAAAEEQVRLVLAYVAEAGREAGRAVRDEVFTPGLVRPTRHAVAGLEAAGLAGDSTDSGRSRP